MKERKKKLGELGLELEEEEALICKVCLSIYDSSFRVPQLLPCGHTFCSICIEKHLDKGNANKAPCRNKEKCQKNVQVKWQDETKKGSGSIKIKCPFCDSINLAATPNKMSLNLLSKIQNNLRPGEILVQKDFFETPNGIGWEEGEMEFLGVKPGERNVLKSKNPRLNPRDSNKNFIDNGFKSNKGYVIQQNTLDFPQIGTSENPPQFKENGTFHHNVTEGIEMQIKTITVDDSNQIIQGKETKRYPPTLKGIFSQNPAYKSVFEEAGIEWNYFTSSNIEADNSLPKYSDLTHSPGAQPYSSMYPDLSSQESFSNLSTNGAEESSSVLSFNFPADQAHQSLSNSNTLKSSNQFGQSGINPRSYTGVIASNTNFGS